MDISLDNRRVARLCNEQRRAVRQLGQAAANRLRRRLDDLAAAPNLEALRNAPGRCHELTGNRAGQFAMTVSGGWRLVFVPDHDPVPMRSAGGIDWSSVTRVLILEVVDYHV